MARVVRLTAATTREGSSWVARCLEVDITSQGESFVEPRDNLVEALELLQQAGRSAEEFEGLRR